MSSFTITLVMDNHAQDGLAAEHGYALHLATEQGDILLDAAQSSLLMNNANTLGIDFSKLSSLILSHGHYDHTGNIHNLLTSNAALNIYYHPDALLDRFSLDGEDPKIVKMHPKGKKSINSHPAHKLHQVTKPTTIGEQLRLTGPVPRKTDFEDTGGSFFLDEQGTNVDLINDDMSLWFDSPQGLVICLGCCHSGIINTLNYIFEIAGTQKIHTIIGGMHLVNASPHRLEQTVQHLNSFEINRLIACHCSGDKATEYLQANAQCEVSCGYAGLRLNFP